MSNETPNPKPERRRRFIASVLVFLAVVTSAWYWPRRDGRLVGRWAVTGHGQVMTFRKDGTSLSVRAGNDQQLSTWRVEGTTLILGSEPPNWLGRGLAILEGPIRSWTGFRIRQGQEELFLISEITESSVQLRPIDDDGVITLTRVLE